MKYTLNPYTIIFNVEDSFTFMGKANKTVTADLNGSQKQLLGELSKGSFLESELLKSSFGEELYSSLIENASLVATEPDTTSYTSRTYAFTTPLAWITPPKSSATSVSSFLDAEA